MVAVMVLVVVKVSRTGCCGFGLVLSKATLAKDGEYQFFSWLRTRSTIAVS